MGKKTSVYLNPPLEQLLEAKPQPLPEALYRGLAVEPLLIERNDAGDFTTHWYCAVPPEGAKFKVHHDHWLSTHGERPVREIYSIEVTNSEDRS